MYCGAGFSINRPQTDCTVNPRKLQIVLCTNDLGCVVFAFNLHNPLPVLDLELPLCETNTTEMVRVSLVLGLRGATGGFPHPVKYSVV